MGFLKETEGPAQVRPRAVRRRGGRVGPIIDSITLISKDKIKEQLADPLFASKPRVTTFHSHERQRMIS